MKLTENKFEMCCWQPHEDMTTPAQLALTDGTVESAILSIAVTPWGELVLDGKIQGISPPLAALKIKPDRHQIEILNRALPQYSQTSKVDSGRTRTSDTSSSIH